jgi:uncharacterized protein YraI
MKISPLKTKFLLAATTFLSLAGLPQAGEAAMDIYTGDSVYLRAGPNKDYPIVARLDGDTAVNIFGCITGWAWCDVAIGDYRGWVSGRHLRSDYHHRPRVVYSYGASIGVPIIVFEERSYWDRHYRHRSFYAQRRWRDDDRDWHHNDRDWRNNQDHDHDWNDRDWDHR